MIAVRAALLALCAALCVVPAGCASAPPERPKANLAFAGKPKIAVPASRIEFVDAYAPPLAAPNVEHEHDFRPTHLMRVWLNERLAMDPSAPGKLVVHVGRASVIEMGAPTESSITDALKRESERKLTGRLDWTMVYEGPDVQWETSAYAESVRSVSPNASLNDVDRAYNSIIEALSDHLDQRIEEQISSLRRARTEANLTP